jgi:hypothetical protein
MLGRAGGPILLALFLGLGGVGVVGVGCARWGDPHRDSVTKRASSPASLATAAAEPAAAAVVAGADPPIAGGSDQPVDFARQVAPILAARCQPCHFPGGSMHQRLPFDREETIHELGEALFSRIDDPAERALIQALLDQRRPAS